MQRLPPPPGGQRPPGPHAFDTSSRALRDWLAALPRGHMGELSRHLHQALSEVNTLRLPAARRFEFLERIGRPMAELLPQLRSHFAGRPLPLDEQATAVARLSDELLSGLFNGYRILLDEPGSVLRRITQRRMRSLVIHRLLRYGSALICNRRLRGDTAPAGLWQALHRLFPLAAAEGRLRHRAGWFDRPEQQSSLADEYKRMLLLAMLDSRHLNAEQQAAVLEGVDGWLEGLRLLKFDAGDAGDTELRQRGRFFLDLEADAGPRPMAEWTETEGDARIWLLLDSAPLEHRLLERLAAAGDAAPEQAGRRLCRDTLETLLINWCRPPRTHEQRSLLASLRCLGGIGAIYRQLQHLDDVPLPPTSSQPAPAPAPLSAREMLRRRSEEGSVWQLSGAHNEQPRSWSQRIAGEDTRETAEFDAELLEIEGERALAVAGSHPPLRIGEPIACHEPDGEHWRLSQLRWLRREEGRLLAGVEPLLADARPALVRLRGGPLTPCVWGPDAVGEAILLLLPSQLGFGGLEIELDHHGHATTLQLLRQRAESAHFDAWQLAEADGTPLPRDLDDH